MRQLVRQAMLWWEFWVPAVAVAVLVATVTSFANRGVKDQVDRIFGQMQDDKAQYKIDKEALVKQDNVSTHEREALKKSQKRVIDSLMRLERKMGLPEDAP